MWREEDKNLHRPQDQEPGNKLIYKAFVSYSHQDEAWGKWLQRALESYRVPRRLVGTEGKFGPVSARLSPIFRDREDLSSAADLSASVRNELAASESLVVICSPAAAASRWVNEEVRHFQELGRRDRILALIVDGDPQSTDPANRCFPPALLEGADGESFEPLAADARKFADGKTLARLKLVAGILGIRLDELRQRDMQRKHRLWMISASGAMLVAVLTSVLAVVAITARNQAENRREQAENLVGYMVGDLQSELQEVGRLDILQGMGGAVSEYLETLDSAEVTDTSLLQQARVWRHLGDASMDQGRLDDAKKQFTASRNVLSELHRRDRDNIERVYEMAQAEFWVGYVDLEMGQYDTASQALEKYLEYANALGDMEPDKAEWLMEQSMAHGNIAALIIREGSDDAERALQAASASVELIHRVMDLEPNNETYISDYGEALAWQADTQLLFCDLGGALEARQESVRIAKEMMDDSPGNINLRRRYAYTLTGLANVARMVGLADYAIGYFERAGQVLGELYASDRTNMDLHWDALIRDYYRASLLAEGSSLQLALDEFSSLYGPMRDVIDSEDGDNRRRRTEWIDYQLDYAAVLWRSGNPLEAERLWTSAVDEVAAWLERDGAIEGWEEEIVKSKLLIWHYDRPGEKEVSRTEYPFVDLRLESDRKNPSCGESSLLALQALVEGDEAEARARTEYLLARGYYEPGFVRICRHYKLCQGPG